MAKRLPVPLDDEQAAWVEQMAARSGLSQARVVSQCVDAVRGEPAPLLADHADGLPDVLADLQERVADLEAAVEQATDSPHERPSASTGSTPPTRTDAPTPAPPDDATRQADSDDERPEQRDAVGLDDVLEDWRPGRGAGERREAMRAAGRAAVEMLRADGGPLQRAEFEELWAEYPVPDQSPPSENDTYWRKSLRPALQRAIGAGLARQVEGSWEYYWEGGDGDGLT